MDASRRDGSAWSPLPTTDWWPTLETLHLWTQVLGKIRLVQSPWLNHSWNVALYVTPVGLTTGPVPHADEFFEWTIDVGRSAAGVVTSTGVRREIELTDGLSVAAFHSEVMAAMAAIDMPVTIHTTPSEIADAVPFPDDTEHATYLAPHARALHRALLDSTRVFERFRAGYRGKASRVHFFWGSFDLAVTRFSGRDAPAHPGGIPNFPDDVAREAYSHELTSAGFWPGTASAPTPVFYAYAYPAPDGFSEGTVEPAEAGWNAELGEFVLAYDDVARAADPDATLLAFLESTHGLAADLAGWDRERLECHDPYGPAWWERRPHSNHESSTQADDEVEIRDDAERHRYVLLVGGAERGAAVYHRRADRWIFVHTEIDPSVEGRGLGSQLARAALDDVARQGGRVVPLCPFIAQWIERHADYDHLVDRDALDRLTS